MNDIIYVTLSLRATLGNEAISSFHAEIATLRSR